MDELLTLIVAKKVVGSRLSSNVAALTLIKQNQQVRPGRPGGGGERRRAGWSRPPALTGVQRVDSLSVGESGSLLAVPPRSFCVPVV